jgi:DNA helicase-2/ATP-dependent DNA helicase PcrA
MSDTLNKDQLQAITHGSGPLLIVAGAGTGKTTVITHRIKHLIETSQAKPEEILALTFTEKAALEMETRLDQRMPLGYTQMWISTFHSFCERILRTNALAIGLDPDFKIINQVSAVSLFRKHLFDLPLDYYRPLGNPNKFISAIINLVSRLKDEDISTEEYSNWATSAEDKELALCYQKYEQLKIDNGVMDYADLISHTVSLFRSRPKILAAYATQFKYILVDEFQDTNYVQNQLINILASHRNLTVVADDDQAIYRFRGAAVGNVLSFQSAYQPKLVVLTKNYRSRQFILNAAHQLISHNNPHRLEVAANINKQLASMRTVSSGSVQLIHAQNSQQEAELVANQISSLLTTDSQLSPSDIAILVRANSHAASFVSALAYLGIPTQFMGPSSLYAQPEIRDLICFLRVLSDPLDDTSLYQFLQCPIFFSHPLQVTKLLSQAKRNSTALFDLLPPDLSAIFTKALSTPASPSQKIYDLLSDSGALKKFFEPNSDTSASQAKNIAAFLIKLKTYESDYPQLTLTELLEWLDLSQDLGESPQVIPDTSPDSTAVSIMTVHASKGLEFPIVFLVNLVSDRFPSRNRADQLPVPTQLVKDSLPEIDFHLQEERRLFYVGLTRAKDQVYLSFANYYGQSRHVKKPSPFIAETIGHFPSFANQVPTINLSQTKLAIEHRIPNTKITYLTYSHIDTFQTCPLHYKAKYILNLPSSPTPSLSLGNSIHQALAKYARSGGDLLIHLQDHWQTAGYSSRAHRDQAYLQAKKFLTAFSATYPALTPIHVEYDFKFPLSPDLTLGGRFDRIDQLPDQAIHIIDYKTGKPKTQKEADSDLQLSIYALAAQAIFHLRPSKIQLSFYYFQTQSFLTTTRSQLQLDQAAQTVLDLRDQIQTSDFACSRTPLCQSCEFRPLCN